VTGFTNGGSHGGHTIIKSEQILNCPIYITLHIKTLELYVRCNIMVCLVTFVSWFRKPKIHRKIILNRRCV
jgi:hypothetical protein